MTGMTYVTCSWCHRTCAQKDRRCLTCGHNPSVARVDCDCGQCRGLLANGLLGGIAEGGLLGDSGQGGLLGDLFPEKRP